MKYLLHVGLNALKILLFSSVLSLFSCKAQEMNNENYIDSYYSIIHEIISKDSIGNKRKIQKINEYDLDNKNIIIDSISNEKSKIYLKQFNPRLKSLMQQEFENWTKYSPLRDYFGDEKIRIALRSFPKESTLDKTKLKSFTIIKDKNQFGHIFSSPVIIDNKIIIFHAKFLSKYTMYSRILIYEIRKGKKPKLIRVTHREIS